MKILLTSEKKWTLKIQKSKIVILVLNQYRISAVFPIVQFPGDPKTALTGDPLYISLNSIMYFLSFHNNLCMDVRMLTDNLFHPIVKNLGRKFLSQALLVKLWFPWLLEKIRACVQFKGFTLIEFQALHMYSVVRQCWSCWRSASDLVFFTGNPTPGRFPSGVWMQLQWQTTRCQ